MWNAVGPVFGNNKRLERKLRETGRKANATVLKCKTGSTIVTNYTSVQIVCHLRLNVTPDLEPPFEADLTQQFPAMMVPREGQQLSVLYDPNNHKKVVHEADPATPMWGVGAGAAAMVLTRGADGNIVPINLAAGSTQSIPGAAAPAAPDRIEQLEKLADLKARGALTDEEFQTEKKRLLGG